MNSMATGGNQVIKHWNNSNLIFFCLLGQHLIQHCVIIQRDEKGYGLTVTGDNPVYVQSVKEGVCLYHCSNFQFISAGIVFFFLSKSLKYYDSICVDYYSETTSLLW